MLRKAQTLIGATVRSSDAEDIGKIDDFFFDDQEWTIRYFVVDTGPWLLGRKVLVAPESVTTPIGREDTLPVNLTAEQVENSPEIDVDKPVSRQQEVTLHDYYQWRYYWVAVPGAVGRQAAGGIVPLPGSEEFAKKPSEPGAEEVGDPHLRSIKEVTGYHIAAVDGEIGHVEDFFIDTAKWQIGFMLVDTRNWLPGKDVLVSPDWIDRVSWHGSKVHVNVTREQVQESQEFAPVTSS